MKVLVSACLLGQNCKYNGGNNYHAGVAEFLRDKEAVPVCPELLSGLPVPRPPVEIVNGVLTDCNGRSVDAMYRGAVKKVLAQIAGQGIELAILQSRSPTCGVKQIYDGSFSGRLTEGQGIFAAALAAAGYKVLDAEDFASGKNGGK